MAATMCLVTAFFDPRTRTSPRRGPEGSISHASDTRTEASGAVLVVRVFRRSAPAESAAPPRPTRPAWLWGRRGGELGGAGRARPPVPGGPPVPGVVLLAAPTATTGP